MGGEVGGGGAGALSLCCAPWRAGGVGDGVGQ